MKKIIFLLILFTTSFMYSQTTVHNTKVRVDVLPDATVKDTLIVVADTLGNFSRMLISDLPIALTLDELNDVIISNPIAGSVLKYSGTSWIVGTDEGGTAGTYTFDSPLINTASVITLDQSLLSITESQISNLVHTTNTNLSEAEVDGFVANNGYLTSFTELDPVFSAWDKDYADLINTPIITDSQTLSLSGNDLSISSGNTIDLTGILTTPALNDQFAISANYSTLATDIHKKAIINNGNITLSNNGGAIISEYDIYFLNNSGGNVIISLEAGQQVLNSQTLPLTLYDGQYAYAEYIALNTWSIDYGNEGIITETDPIFTAWNKSYTDLINTPTIPTNNNQLTNGAGFISSFTELDPVFTAWDKDFADLINAPEHLPKNMDIATKANYTTLLAEGGYFIYVSSGDVTLDATGLPVGFHQVIYNDSGVDINLVSSNTIKGANNVIPSGMFGTYVLTGTTTWTVSTPSLAVSGAAQTLSIVSNDLTISGGNTVTLPTGSGVSNLTDLSDVSTVTPVLNNYLKFDGTTWTNSVISKSHIPDFGTYLTKLEDDAVPKISASATSLNMNYKQLNNVKESYYNDPTAGLYFYIRANEANNGPEMRGKGTAGIIMDYNNVNIQGSLFITHSDALIDADLTGFIVPSKSWTLSKIASSGGITTETDPIFSAWDKDYFDLINTPTIPTNNNQLTNGAGYLTTYSETDPVYSLWNKSSGISIYESQVLDLTHTVNTDNQNASQVVVTTTAFNNNLSSLENTVQKALDKIDDLSLSAGTGTITGVTAGNGLTGGGTTGTVTLNIGAGTGITVAADAISTTLGTSISNTEIETGAVNSASVLDNSLTASDLGASSVGTSELADNSILEADLKATNSAAAGQLLTFASASTGFTWIANDFARLGTANTFTALNQFNAGIYMPDFSNITFGTRANFYGGTGAVHFNLIDSNLEIEDNGTDRVIINRTTGVIRSFASNANITAIGITGVPTIGWMNSSYFARTDIAETFDSTVTATAFYETSLRALKMNITPFIKSGLDIINNLKIVEYDRISGTKNKIGIIIDDSPKEVANEDQTAVDLYKTIFIQAKAIQELDDKVKSLEQRLEKLEKLISE